MADEKMRGEKSTTTTAKKKERKGKRKKINKPTSQRWTKYKIEGEKVVRGRFCPRCGDGIFLSVAKDRVYCGKCHYTEFSLKK